MKKNLKDFFENFFKNISKIFLKYFPKIVKKQVNATHIISFAPINMFLLLYQHHPFHLTLRE